MTSQRSASASGGAGSSGAGSGGAGSGPEDGGLLRRTYRFTAALVLFGAAVAMFVRGVSAAGSLAVGGAVALANVRLLEGIVARLAAAAARSSGPRSGAPDSSEAPRTDPSSDPSPAPPADPPAEPAAPDSGSGGAFWSVVALFKTTGLLMGLWLLFRLRLVEPLAFTVGYLCLVPGIVAAAFTTGKAHDSEL